MSSTAKLFRNGRSQAVRLPMEFRLPGDSVKVRRVGKGILLEPISTDIEAWFHQMDDLHDPSFMKKGRNQPRMPVRKVF
ncbi:MAG: AbrB/MazE/SpoVT family DNA-binding domain-containing protein [Acidobacteria bacterium]|nr:AbrB/MazE/SpoVT family DNA-binding domain-containing protein [Acidobacteriota bacterium]